MYKEPFALTDPNYLIVEHNDLIIGFSKKVAGDFGINLDLAKSSNNKADLAQ